MTVTAIAHGLAGLLAAGIVVIGLRFLVAPAVAAAGYGVPADPAQPSVGAFLAVKGVRDIATGLFVVVPMLAGATHLVGWVMLTAFGIHGATAAVMLVMAALLLVS